LLTRMVFVRIGPVTDPEILKEWGAEDNVGLSAQSSFIANVNNEIYAFYTGKIDLLKRNCYRGRKGDHPHFPLTSPLNPPRHGIVQSLHRNTLLSSVSLL